MSTGLVVWLGLLLGANFNWGSLGAQAKNAAPIDVGGRKQLFIDHRFIESCHGIRLTVNPPVKKEIVLRPEGQETGGMFWISAVLEVDGEYLMYYGTWSARSTLVASARRVAVMHLARSKDGIRWERVPVGLFDVGQGKNNNIVMLGAWGTVFLDPNETDGCRFWMMGLVEEKTYEGKPKEEPSPKDKKKKKEVALHLCRSKDGIHWTHVKEPILPFTCDTRNQCLFDPRLNKYVAYVRGRPGGHQSRVVCRAENTKLLGTWPFKPDPDRETGPNGRYGWIQTELPIVMEPRQWDPPKFGLYTPNVHIYPWAEEVYLAFPDAYRLRDGIPSYGRDERGKPANEGPLDIALAVSRDGVSWRRFPAPYVRLGQIGEIDAGTIYMGVGMIRRGNEIWQYATVSPHTHGGIGKMLPGMEGGILRLAQRLDGFVSADAGPDGGELTTPPVLFAGNRLELNVDCSATGEVWVEVRDANGTPIPGYTMEQAVSVDMNGSAQKVWWRQGPDVGKLAGKPVRLHFRMRSAKLYAFRFTKE